MFYFGTSNSSEQPPLPPPQLPDAQVGPPPEMRWASMPAPSRASMPVPSRAPMPVPSRDAMPAPPRAPPGRWFVRPAEHLPESGTRHPSGTSSCPVQALEPPPGYAGSRLSKRRAAAGCVSTASGVALRLVQEVAPCGTRRVHSSSSSSTGGSRTRSSSPPRANGTAPLSPPGRRRPASPSSRGLTPGCIDGVCGRLSLSRRGSFLKGSRNAWGSHDYNEDLQENLYLGTVFKPPDEDRIPVKNTFIQYYVPMSGTSEVFQQNGWKSSPGKLLQKSFHTKYPQMEEAHLQGRCKPCAYHLYKKDGCRWGAECEFCHLCKPGELKKRKKVKMKAIREARQARAGRGDPQGAPIGNGSTGSPDEAAAT